MAKTFDRNAWPIATHQIATHGCFEKPYECLATINDDYLPVDYQTYDHTIRVDKATVTSATNVWPQIYSDHHCWDVPDTPTIARNNRKIQSLEAAGRAQGLPASMACRRLCGERGQGREGGRETVWCSIKERGTHT